jgi:hypothetical protein
MTDATPRAEIPATVADYRRVLALDQRLEFHLGHIADPQRGLALALR